ncbi:MAG: SpoIIE family protein phosphatase [Nocardioidaceae bacterium]
MREILTRSTPPEDGPTEWHRSLLLAALVAVGYAAGSLLAWRLLDAGASPVFFAPAGVTAAALISTDRRRWPWILAAAGLTEIALDLVHGEAGAAAVGFAVANVVEPLVGASLVRSRLSQVDLSIPRHALVFLGYAVVAGPLVGGAIGATTDAGRLDRAWLASFGIFWAGDALGVLTVGGTILAWRGSIRLGRAQVLTDLWPAAALGTAALAATLVGFAWTRGPFVLPTAVLFVAATRGMAPLATSAGVFAITANVLSAGRAGPWKDVAASDHRAWLSLQLFIAVTELGAGALASGLAQRDRARGARDRELAARLHVEGLRNVASRLSVAETITEIAEVVAQHGLSQVASIGSVGLLSSDGTEVRTAAFGLPEDVARAYAVVPLDAPRPLCQAIRANTAVVTQTLAETLALFPTAEQTYERLRTRCVLAVPIVPDGQRAIGALGFVFEEEHAATPELVALAEELARETAAALVRARRFEAERRTARELQRALLPQIAPAPAPGVTASARYQPADPEHEVGGDWYDVFTLDDDRVAIAVGDVVGHDVQAATAMGRLQPLLRVLAHEASDPADALARLDRASRHLDGATMATVGLAFWDSSAGELAYSCAGHPPPLFLDDSGATFLDAASGLPLGVDAAAARGLARVPVTGTSQLVWYTDGLVERRRESLSVGLERLLRCGQRQGPGVGPDDLSHTLLAQLTRGEPLSDDVVVVCVRLAPVSGEEPGSDSATIRVGGH